MMKVNEKINEGIDREYEITIPSNEIDEKIAHKLNEVGKQVKIPGFRPGKVPMGLLKKRFGASVRSEILEATLQESTQKLFEEKNIKPASQPKIDLISFEDGSDLEFSLKLQLVPEIELTDMSAFKVERLISYVSDEDVDDATKKMAENNKISVPLTKRKTIKDGDVAVIDFVGFKDDKEFEGGKAEGFKLELGSGRFIPGFEEKIVGMKVGSKKDLELTFPDNYENDDLKGQDVVFKVTLKSIETLQVPEVDEDFSKSIGFDSLKDLKDAVNNQINKDYEYLSRMKIKREMLDFLAENNNFEVPSGLVNEQFDLIWKNILQAKESNSLDDKDSKMSEEELEKHYRNIAERRVRLGLILSDVSDKNNLSIGPEELSQAISLEASKFPGQEKNVMEYYNSNPQALEQVRAPLLEDKVIDFLLEMCEISEKNVSSKELKELTGATEVDGPVPV